MKHSGQTLPYRILYVVVVGCIAPAASYTVNLNLLVPVHIVVGCIAPAASYTVHLNLLVPVHSSSVLLDILVAAGDCLEVVGDGYGVPAERIVVEGGFLLAVAVGSGRCHCCNVADACGCCNRSTEAALGDVIDSVSLIEFPNGVFVIGFLALLYWIHQFVAGLYSVN